VEGRLGRAEGEWRVLLRCGGGGDGGERRVEVVGLAASGDGVVVLVRGEAVEDVVEERHVETEVLRGFCGRRG
jgi:hypothetical protein